MTAEHGPRGPGVVYAALSLLMIIIVGTLALTARQQPPPTIAEFAPQAVEQITESPTDQSASGPGRGGSGAAVDEGVGVLEDPTQPAIDVPRVRRCVGDPPRQIEDPQSPPCVPYWEGDNGGATWQGVTRDEIRVAFGEKSGDDFSRDLSLLETFFNRRFEFYGRKLHFIPFQAVGDDGAGAADMLADAVRVDEELRVFADQNYDDRAGNEVYFYDELARRGIVNVQQRPAFTDEAHRQQMAPYQWSYLPGTDVAGRNVGEWTCKTLASRPPEYASGAERTRPERVFGLWRHYTPDQNRPDAGPLRAELAACGVSFAEEVEVMDPGTAESFQQEYRNAVLQLQSAGVTSIICLCRPAALVWSSEPAMQSAYFPEWLISTWMDGDDDYYNGVLRQGTQSRQTFGLSFWSKRGPLVEAPCQKATKEVDPTFEWPSRNNNLDSAYSWCYMVYQSALLLASGLQMAGPNLTPQSFEAGLFRAKFPNQNAGQAPDWQAFVDFGPNDHTMNDDAAVVWWNPNRKSEQLPGNASGTFCYFDHGSRHGLGEWRSGPQALFTGDCT